MIRISVPSSFPTALPLLHSTTATLSFEHTKEIPASGPLHLLCPLAEMPFLRYLPSSFLHFFRSLLKNHLINEAFPIPFPLPFRPHPRLYFLFLTLITMDFTYFWCILSVSTTNIYAPWGQGFLSTLLYSTAMSGKGSRHMWMRKRTGGHECGYLDHLAWSCVLYQPHIAGHIHTQSKQRGGSNRAGVWLKMYNKEKSKGGKGANNGGMIMIDLRK